LKSGFCRSSVKLADRHLGVLPVFQTNCLESRQIRTN